MKKYVVWLVALVLVPHMLVEVLLFVVAFVKRSSLIKYVLATSLFLILGFYLSSPQKLFNVSLELEQAVARVIYAPRVSMAVMGLLVSFRDYSIASHLMLLCFSALIGFFVYVVISADDEIKTFQDSVSEVKKMKLKKFMSCKDKQLNRTVIGLKGNRYVSVADNARHVFACGTTGSGKTVLLANFIEQAVRKNYPLLIIDGKGDTGAGSIYEVVQKLKGDKKLYVINLNDIAASSLYNPFKNSSPTVAKDMLISMTTWSEEHYKANAERYLQRLMWTMEIMNLPLSFSSILEYISEEMFLVIATEAVKQGLISKEEHIRTLEIVKASLEITERASARFATLSESEIGQIFDEAGIDIIGALQENAIILFVLDPLSYPEVSPLLGRLILIDAKKAINTLFRERKERVFFVLDEINVYASPALIDLLGKSRSANTTCIMATQSLADLDYSYGEAFRDQVIESCNNYIVLRQNSHRSAESWANVLGTRPTMEMTYQVGEQANIIAPTGRGSARRVREYIYHPDEIKHLPTGNGIYMSKDENTHCQVDIKKGNYFN